MRKMKEEYADEVAQKKVDDQITIENVVRGNEGPSCKQVFKWIGDLFRRRRPLYPILETRGPVCTIDEYTQLVVRIGRALNVPRRTQFSLGPVNNPEPIYLKPLGGDEGQFFIRICLDDDVRLTRVAPNDWNELIRFDLCPDPENIPSMAEVGSKTLRFDLFDRVQFGDDNTVEATEERFLGSLELPLSAVWATGEISGQFPLNTPPMLVGYETENPGPIGLFASIAFAPRVVFKQQANPFKSSESPDVSERVDLVMKEISKKKFKHPRSFDLMASRTDATSCLLCRLIHPISPPEGIDSPLKIIRFVSSIPYVPDSVTFDTSGDVWCTCQEFLDMRQGDEEEHAILLCNMLKTIGKDAYVALGSDVMNGNAAYVIIIYDDHIVVVDPVRGNLFDPSSTSCTLTNVGVVFNDENVWLNIQKNVAPLLMTWDLYNPKCWRPFFSQEEFPFIPHSVTENDVQYDEVQQEFAVDLERDVEESIKQCIQEDRGEQLKTVWSESASRIIKKTLDEIVKLHTEQQVPQTQEILRDLEDQLQDYRVNGSPFALSFTSIERITDEIRAQGTFITELDDVEFALAVSVVPLPHKMYFVWVFLMALQKVPGGNLNFQPPVEEETEEESRKEPPPVVVEERRLEAQEEEEKKEDASTEVAKTDSEEEDEEEEEEEEEEESHESKHEEPPKHEEEEKHEESKHEEEKHETESEKAPSEQDVSAIVEREQPEKSQKPEEEESSDELNHSHMSYL